MIACGKGFADESFNDSLAVDLEQTGEDVADE